jgi:hypothetical protein
LNNNYYYVFFVCNKYLLLIALKEYPGIILLKTIPSLSTLSLRILLPSANNKVSSTVLVLFSIFNWLDFEIIGTWAILLASQYSLRSLGLR